MHTKQNLEKGFTIKREELAPGGSNLIALSGGVQGEVGRTLLKGNIQESESLLKQYQKLFPENFYIEVCRVGGPNEEEYLQLVIPLATKLGIPVVASNDVRFVNPDEFVAHDIRVCINDGRILDDPRRPRRYTEHQYLRNRDQMANLFHEIPTAIENTLHIAQRCNVFLDFNTVHMPVIPSVSGQNANKLLLETARTRLAKRIEDGQITCAKESVSEEYNTRLDEEIAIIQKMGYSDYFLIVSDFIDWARENSIPVGPGRGSGAGSLVAYALGITQLDPIIHGLLFERFLNPERVSLPDFDIDFCMLGRDRVIEHVADRYGKDKVAQIITFNSLAARAVVRDVGRVMGLSYGFCDVLAKLIPFEVGMTLEKALEQDEELRSRYNSEPEVGQLIDNARLLEGMPRNAGKHAGGIVIAPKKITQYTALYWEQGMTQPVTQFDKDDLESIGLVKFDFLGLRTLTVIDWTLLQVNQRNNEKSLPNIDLEVLPIDDPDTFEFIRSGRTTALFQLESRGMRELVQRIQPESFDDLTALVALFRPGPLQSGMVDDYIDRKHGRKRVDYPHPDVEHILKPTYGVILYQEQVMQIAQVLAGYTLGAADLLRRAMGKKKAKAMERQRSIFIEGAENRGVTTDVASYIFDLMEKFAGYGFNKSHSAAYAMLSYQTAWLKTHYPEDYMAAALSADMENTDKIVILIDECRNLGIDICSPNINQSYFQFKVAGQISLLYGLGAIKGVGAKAVESILIERDTAGPFNDIFDFCLRVDSHKCNKRACEALVTAGAFDVFGEHRAALLQALPSAMGLAGQQEGNRSSGQDDMFGLNPTQSVRPINLPIAPWSELQRLEHERSSLGLYLTGHPIQYHSSELEQIVEGKIGNINSNPERIITIAGLVSGFRTYNTRRGENMAFISLNDQTGKADVSVFGELYARARKLVQTESLLVVCGSCSTDERTGELQVRASWIDTIESLRQRALKKVVICLNSDTNSKDPVKMLSELFIGVTNGQTEIELRYLNSKEDEISMSLGAEWNATFSDALIEKLFKQFGESKVQLIYSRSKMQADSSKGQDWAA